MMSLLYGKIEVTNASNIRVWCTNKAESAGGSPTTHSIYGARDGKRMWKDTTDTAWQNPSLFGTANLAP